MEEKKKDGFNVQVNISGQPAAGEAVDEETATKERLRQRRLERRNRRNARIARGRFLKNLFIWFLGVIFLPIALVVSMFVVPIGAITGKNEVVSEELGKKSVFEAVKFIAGNSSDLGFSDFPIIANSFNDLSTKEVFDGKTVGDIVYIDTEKLNTIKFGGSDMMEQVMSCIDVIATLKTFGGAELLGDFGELSVFTEESVAGTVAEIEAKGETSEARKAYYSKTADGYKRAFNDDGSRVAGLNNEDILYYPPIEQIKILELKDIIGESFGRTTVKSLLKIFGIESTEEHANVIVDILGTDAEGNDMTIAGLNDFDITGIKLETVIGEYASANSGTQKLYDVLSSALNDKDVSLITIGDLTGSEFNVNNIKLKDVLTLDDDTYDILCEAVEGEIKPTKDTITIGDLSNIDIEAIPLDTVLTVEEDSTLDKVLKAAVVGSGEEGEILLKDLTGDNFKIGKVPLATVLTIEENSTLDKVLKAAITGSGEGNAILLEDLTGDNFDIGEVPLNTVLTLEEGSTLDKVLKAAVVGTGEGDEILIKDLSGSGFDANKIHLATVLPYKDAENNPVNTTLYKILRDATGVEGANEEAKNDNITLQDLKSFTPSNIHLNTVLEDVDLTENSVLSALKAKDITVSQIGTALNGLSLYEVYGNKAFTTTPKEGARRFNKGTDGEGKTYYEYNESGDYYLDSGAGLWLIICYKTSAIDENGNPQIFTEDTLTIGSLQNGSSLAEKFRNATVKQLIEAGLIQGADGLDAKIKKLSLQDLFDVLSDEAIQTAITLYLASH